MKDGPPAVFTFAFCLFTFALFFCGVSARQSKPPQRRDACARARGAERLEVRGRVTRARLARALRLPGQERSSEDAAGVKDGRATAKRRETD
jgi:hypothetical protein